MSETAALRIVTPIRTEDSLGERPATSPLSEFEDIYRANISALVSFFARRCHEPQIVADLASETILRAATGFAGFDPRRGTARGWLFGIARHVYAQHCAHAAAVRDSALRLSRRANLPEAEHDELIERIDAASASRTLLDRFAALSPPERAAVELVDMDGLSPKDAAVALGVSRGVLRMRLYRARSRLREEHHASEQL